MMKLERISTADVAASERLPFWNEIASRMITPLRVEPLGQAPFTASIACCRMRGCEIISPISSPARVYRETEYEAGLLNIQVQHKGRTTNHTAGRTATLEESDFLLYDPARPLWLSFAEPTQTIVLRLPLATVEERLPHLHDLAGVPMSGRSGPGALFSSFLRQAWVALENGVAGEWAQGLEDAIWPLLDLAYADLRPSVEINRREERRRALFEAVASDLTDPELDVHRLARRMGVSPRYVQMLFADLGTTPRGFIQERRLELAASRLEHEGSAITVTDVAYDVGFSDLSSFCRAFRRRFRTSARNYRSGTRG